MSFVNSSSLESQLCRGRCGAPWHRPSLGPTINISAVNSCRCRAAVHVFVRTCVCVCVWGCVLMLGSKKPRFIWRSRFSFTAAASWLLGLTVLFSWLKSGSFHSPPKQGECHEVPMVNHIHIYIWGLIQNAKDTMGEAVFRPTMALH